MVLSRRGFVGTLAGTAGVLALGRTSACFAVENGDFGPFRIGMQSYTLREFPLAKALDTMESLGIETVEFFDAHYPSASNDAAISTMNEQLGRHKLKVLSHGVHAFTKDHEANKRLFDFARRAGIRNLTADPTEDAFDSLDKLVAEYNIRIAIHNHGPGARYDKITSVLTAIKDRHPNIGACADLGHYIRSGEDPVRAIQLFEGRLFGIHLKDFDAPRGDAKGCLLGTGVLDLVGTFKALKKVNFPNDACLAVEYEENPADPTEDLRQSLVAAKAAVQKALA